MIDEQIDYAHDDAAKNGRVPEATVLVDERPTAAAPPPESVHRLTEAQKNTLRPLMERLNHIQEIVAVFLGYIEKEANLPKSTDGWRLGFDQQTQQPVMVGHIESQK